MRPILGMLLDFRDACQAKLASSTLCQWVQRHQGPSHLTFTSENVYIYKEIVKYRIREFSWSSLGYEDHVATYTVGPRSMFSPNTRIETSNLYWLFIVWKDVRCH